MEDQPEPVCEPGSRHGLAGPVAPRDQPTRPACRVLGPDRIGAAGGPPDPTPQQERAAQRPRDNDREDRSMRNSIVAACLGLALMAGASLPALSAGAPAEEGTPKR